MVGNDLTTTEPNVVTLTDDCKAFIVWDNVKEAWHLELSMNNKRGWQTVLTGHFRKLERLDDLLETTKKLMLVED